MTNNAIEKYSTRLPYHPSIEGQFGVSKGDWRALVEAIYPNAQSADAVYMALSYCKHRKLDVFKKPVHIVSMWDAKLKRMVETVWPSINEVRTTAFRTKQYAGCNEAAFGPDIKKTFRGNVKNYKTNQWEEQIIEMFFPEWCQITVYRLDSTGTPRAYVGPKTYWEESYATMGGSDLPNAMWAKRKRGQLEKCTEAAALRKAFPEEVGDMITAEEMDGQRILADDNIATSTPEPREDSKETPPEPPKNNKPQNTTDGRSAPKDDVKTIDHQKEEKAKAEKSTRNNDTPPEPPKNDEADDVNYQEMFDSFEEAAGKSWTMEELEDAYNDFDFEATFQGDEVSLNIANGIKQQAERRIKREK